jgi:hypothetical protein
VPAQKQTEDRGYEITMCWLSGRMHNTEAVIDEYGALLNDWQIKAKVTKEKPTVVPLCHNNSTLNA